MQKENIFKRTFLNIKYFFKNRNKDNLYKLDGCVPFSSSIILCIEHVLAMFIGNVAPLLVVFSSVSVEGINMTSAIQNAIFIAGIATLLQLYPLYKFGGKIPLVCGVTFTFVNMLIYIGLTYDYGTMIGSVIIGGLFMTILAFFSKYWLKFIKPIVSSLVILTLGLSLLTVSGDYFIGGSNTTSTIFAYGSWQSLLVGFITLLSCLLFQILLKGNLKNLSLLFGITIGYIVSLCFNGVDFSIFDNIQIFALPRFYDFSYIKFNYRAIIPMCLLFIVSSTQDIGSVTMVSKDGLSTDPTNKQIEGTIASNSLISAISGVFGCFPVSTFAQNASIVGQTKIVNRFSLIFVSVFLILASLFPPLGAIFQTIPYPVLGGALVMLFASIAVSGIKMIGQLGFTPKNILITTISLGVGYGFSLINNFYLSLGDIANNILSNPITMVFILSMILSYVIPDNYNENDEK